MKLNLRSQKGSYAQVYDLIMRTLMKKYKPKAKVWGEKTNVCWGQIPNFLKMFPSGKTIHIIRDPRDVMCSFRDKTYEPNYAYLDSAFVSLHSFMAIEKLSKLKNYYLLRYEDFIRDPIIQTKKLCKFLEIDFEPKMLSNFEDKTGGKWECNSSFLKLKGISPKPIGSWKKQASNIEIYFVEMINKTMTKFGYKLSGIELNWSEWKKLYNILEDPLIKKRYTHWLKTGRGLEGYPSDPLTK